MNYLFGDSTPSTLTSNFLEFFRDALDFSVFALQADERIKRQTERIRTLRKEADEEMERLDAFVASIVKAIETAPKGAAESPTAICSVHLTTMSAEALRAALNGVRGKLASEVAAAEAAEAAERVASYKALEALLAPHDPPDATTVVRLELGASGAYEGSAFATTDFGLVYSFALKIPEARSWSEPLRIEQLMAVLEIQAPQVSGFLGMGKSVKVKPQRLERLVVTELVDDGETVSMKLRTELGIDVGFDLEVDPADKKVVSIARVAPKEDASAGDFEAQPEDVVKLLDLAGKLRTSVSELARDHLIEASVDEVEFKELPTFVPFVEQLVAMMAPTVREISERSLTPNELIIRRLVANDRREEIFVAKASLRSKYAPLSDTLQKIFAPLGLEAPVVIRKSERPANEAPPVRSELPASIPPPGPVLASPPVVVPPAAKSEPFVGKNEELVTSLKKIVTLIKGGNVDEGYRGYAGLFSSRAFAEYRPEDQRQALRLMVLKKAPPAPTEAILDAHRVALPRIKALVETLKEPADYELLGVSQVVLSETDAAGVTFTTALALERERSPGSELCGNLMNRLSSL
jgi:hypothetical protein